MIPVKRDYLNFSESLTLSQWKDKANAYGLIKSVIGNLQSSEDVLFDLLNLRSLNTSFGAQLDVIGALFNVDRAGRDDESYRQAISNKISEQAYGVTVPNIYEAFKTASSTSKIEIAEHPYGNIHSYFYTHIQESLADIAKNVTAAGISSYVSFLPIEDGKTEVIAGALDLSESQQNIISFPNDFNFWAKADVSVSSDSIPGPKGDVSGDVVTDTSVVATGLISHSEDVSVNTKYDFLVYVQKGANENTKIEVRYFGTDTNRFFALEINKQTGATSIYAPNSNYLAQFDFDVIDVSSYYLVRLYTDTLNHSSVVITIAPSFSTVFGTEDVTLQGSVGLWGAAYINKSELYSVDIEDFLKTTEVIREEYLVVDEVGDFVVDEIGDNILAALEESFKTLNVYPLGEYNNISISKSTGERI